MSSVIHYKFKVAKSWDTLLFEGAQLSVVEAKRMIVVAKKLNKQSHDFDLILSQKDSAEDYADYATIPKNTSVLVRRVPINKARTLVSKIVTREELVGPSAASDTVSSYSSTNSVGSGDGASLQPTTMTAASSVLPANVAVEGDLHKFVATALLSASSPSPSSLAEIQNTSYDNSSSSAAISQSWSYSTKGGSDNKDFSTLNQSVINDSGPQASSAIRSRFPSRGYLCHKCGSADHLIRNCPLISLTNAQRLHSHAGISMNDSSQILNNRSSQSAVDSTFVLESNTAVDFQRLKNELTCPLCQRYYTNAMIVPCCFASFCDECIRQSLLADNALTCPACQTHPIEIALLQSNIQLQLAVDSHLGIPMETAKEVVDSTVLDDSGYAAVPTSSASVLEEKLVVDKVNTSVLTANIEKLQPDVFSMVPDRLPSGAASPQNSNDTCHGQAGHIAPKCPQHGQRAFVHQTLLARPIHYNGSPAILSTANPSSFHSSNATGSHFVAPQQQQQQQQQHLLQQPQQITQSHSPMVHFHSQQQLRPRIYPHPPHHSVSYPISTASPQHMLAPLPAHPSSTFSQSHLMSMNTAAPNVILNANPSAQFPQLVYPSHMQSNVPLTMPDNSRSSLYSGTVSRNTTFPPTVNNGFRSQLLPGHPKLASQSDHKSNAVSNSQPATINVLPLAHDRHHPPSVTTGSLSTQSDNLNSPVNITSAALSPQSRARVVQSLPEAERPVETAEWATASSSQPVSTAISVHIIPCKWDGAVRQLACVVLDSGTRVLAGATLLPGSSFKLGPGHLGLKPGVHLLTGRCIPPSGANSPVLINAEGLSRWLQWTELGIASAINLPPDFRQLASQELLAWLKGECDLPMMPISPLVDNNTQMNHSNSNTGASATSIESTKTLPASGRRKVTNLRPPSSAGNRDATKSMSDLKQVHLTSLREVRSVDVKESNSSTSNSIATESLSETLVGPVRTLHQHHHRKLVKRAARPEKDEADVACNKRRDRGARSRSRSPSRSRSTREKEETSRSRRNRSHKERDRAKTHRTSSSSLSDRWRAGQSYDSKKSAGSPSSSGSFNKDSQDVLAMLLGD